MPKATQEYQAEWHINHCTHTHIDTARHTVVYSRYC